MNLCQAYSWPYGGDPEQIARAFLTKLKNGPPNRPEPYHRYQVALVCSPRSWFVAVLVLSESPSDDSVEIRQANEAWFDRCGAGGYQDRETMSNSHVSIAAALDERYRIVDAFGSV